MALCKVQAKEKCLIPGRKIYYPISIDEKELNEVQNYIARMGGFEQVRIVIVSNGVSKDEQENYFEQLRKGIESVTENSRDRETEIIYDVSYGLVHPHQAGLWYYNSRKIVP